MRWDLGADHPNPDGQWVGDKHKHHWTPGFRDRFAYAAVGYYRTVASPGGGVAAILR